MNKTCNVCGLSKNLKFFEHQKNRPNPRKTCKLCRSRIRQKNDRKNPEKYEKRLEQRRRYLKEYPERAKNSFLKTKYNITLDDFMKMIELQDNRCAICNNIFKSSKKTHIDHDHKTGKVRGILCSQCNSAIGLFYENVYSLRKAISYLQKNS